MQSQEGQGTLDKCEASQRWGEFTRIKSGCGFFKRSSSGESFAPKMSIQMIKMIGAHVEESCFERTTSICPGVFGFPDAEI